MPEGNSVKKVHTKQHHEDTSYVGSVLGNAGFSNLPMNSSSNNQEDFYEQYKRVLGISYEIKKQLNNQNYLKEELLEKIEELEKNMENNSSIQPILKMQRSESSKKRSRRMADEIERKHKCTVEYCQKQYGSEGSLIQHIKLKHPDLYEAKY